MTEAEWNACTDPQPMLEFLRATSSHRRLRLFGVACCWRVWHLLGDARSRSAIEIAEKYADSRAEASELQGAFSEAHGAYTESDDATVTGFATQVAAHIVEESAWSGAASACEAAAHVRAYEMESPGVSPVASGVRTDLLQVETARQSILLRDIFGPLPFRPVTLDPSWLAWSNGTVPNLAQAIYDERAFDRLPILADALEDAGCHNADVLGHCRGPRPHVRGCWVVDLLLKKA